MCVFLVRETIAYLGPQKGQDLPELRNACSKCMWSVAGTKCWVPKSGLSTASLTCTAGLCFCEFLEVKEVQSREPYSSWGGGMIAAGPSGSTGQAVSCVNVREGKRHFWEGPQGASSGQLSLEPPGAGSGGE